MDGSAPSLEPPETGPFDARAETLRAMSGIFYCGDNLELLTVLERVPTESVDLIYLDPPFNSQRTYNIVYKDSRAQAEAFKDHWSWAEGAQQYAKVLEASTTPPRLRTLLRGLHDLLIDEDADLLAYLAMMAPRIFALHRVLKPTGSLYLHCDPTASHYLKLILDGVFGPKNFLNEIIWKRTSAHSSARRPGPVHDVLLFYARSESYTWNPAFTPHDPSYVASHYRQRDPDGRRWTASDLTAAGVRNGSSGKPWRGFDVTAKGNHWKFTIENLEKLDSSGRLYWPNAGGWPRYKRYLDEVKGLPLQDVWTDVDPLNAKAAERLGFPTQKPLALLERIILASTSSGDLVLDPFCGCGTTIEACERLGRRWIGIDIARKSVEVTESRFKKLGLQAPEVEWFPPDIDAAQALAARSGIKFEEWVRFKIRAARRRKHDRGIDGEAYFRDAENKLHHVLVSVKGGKLNPAMVRELRGTMEREHAPIGVLVVAQEPSKEMRLEATHAGFLKVEDAEGPIPRLQFVTLERIFSNRPAIRAPGVNVTEMPKPVVPMGEPSQLALNLEPAKPTKKVRKQTEEKARSASEEQPKSSRRSGRNAE